MCGITGSVNTSTSRDTLSFIRHRGPDHESLIEEQIGSSTVFLGHTRLSILDLTEAGNQPMQSDCGNYCITFNGEIYNHLELRKKLPEIQFKGHSDTETILYYIKKFGILSVEDFNGIFAFGFLDKKCGNLFLVRDHLGVKPLYFYNNHDVLVFGSELKTILSNKAYNKEIDLHSLNTLLSFRYNPSPGTIFKNIQKLQAGHILSFSFNGTTECISFNQAPQVINYKISKADAIAEYRHLLSQAIKRQLLSDVPVGLLLSGGLDSAILGHLMQQNSGRPIKSFTIGFEGKGDFNELSYARETADLIGSEHFETLIGKKEYLEFFYKSFYHVEEPIAEPTIPALYDLSRLASEQVKVVMSGQGIDEPMAGYKRYIGEDLMARYKPLLSFVPVKALNKLFPRNHTLSRGLYASQFKNDLERFVGIYTIFNDDLKKDMYARDMECLLAEDQSHYFEQAMARADKTNGSLSKLLYIDTHTMLADDLLLFNDKITMAHSIENRVPYLDKDLLSFIESLPIEFKLNGSTRKYLHREAVKGMIPSAIINRKKKGFATPVDEWFQNELSDSLHDMVNSKDSFSGSFFNLSAINQMIFKHKTKKRNYKHELFMLLSLEVWFKEFYQIF